MNPDTLRKQAQASVLAHYGLFKTAYSYVGDLPLIGTALGALAGGAAGYYTAPEDASTRDKVLRAAAGGLGGGALGYGLGRFGRGAIIEKRRKAEAAQEAMATPQQLNLLEERVAKQREEARRYALNVERNKLDLSDAQLRAAGIDPVKDLRTSPPVLSALPKDQAFWWRSDQLIDAKNKVLAKNKTLQPFIPTDFSDPVAILEQAVLNHAEAEAAKRLAGLKKTPEFPKSFEEMHQAPQDKNRVWEF